jgi:hypothetical protein
MRPTASDAAPVAAGTLLLPHVVPPIDLAPLVTMRAKRARIAGPVLSFLILAAALWQLRQLDFAGTVRLVPASPTFWAAFAGYYLASPIAEWAIYRRLWRIPASGLAALLRKFVSNEVLLGYSGEVGFYSWARRHAEVVAAPFGAIKDVTILSALVGNAATLAAIILAFPFGGTLDLDVWGATVMIAVGVFVTTSLATTLVGQRLFSLPVPELRFIFRAHTIRLLLGTALLGWMWHVAMPMVSLGGLLGLATLRLIVSRLPLVPNKDLLFAAMAITLVRDPAAMAGPLAMVGGLMVLVHLVLGALLRLPAILGEARAKLASPREQHDHYAYR